MKKFIINLGITIGITLAQIILLLCMIHLLFSAYSFFIDSIKIDLYWGRSLGLGLNYLFLPSFVLANMVVLFTNRRIIIISINALLLFYVSYMWLSTLPTYPYKSLSIYIIYIVLFFIGVYLIYKLKSKIRKPK